CHPAIARAITLEAPRAAVDHFVQVDLQAAMHLRAKSQADVIFRCDDARARMAQARNDFSRIVANGGHNAEAGNDPSSHETLKRYASGGGGSRRILGQGGSSVGEQTNAQALRLIDDLAVP